MSLINQVLNELEQRGRNPSLGEPAIRAVPRAQRRLPSWLILVVIAGVGVLAVSKWYLERTAEVPPAPPAVVATPKVEALPEALAVASGTESAPQEVSDEAAYSSALNMSYELSTVPSTAKNLHGKPLLAVAQEELPVAPEVKKTPSHQRAANKVARKTETAAIESQASSPLKKITPQQHIENEFSKANLAAEEGRTGDALAGYEQVLRLDPMYHAARLALAGAMVELKRNDDAERVLQEGLQRDAHETSLAMMLARLQVERKAEPQALETLQKALPYAEGQADYQAFMAALLQRQERHKEAITHFQIALQLVPNNGIWLMGMGISLQAVQRTEDARAAYQRALASGALNSQLQAFVQRKLKEL